MGSRAFFEQSAQVGQLTHGYEFETEICSRSRSACTDNVWGVVKDNDLSVVIETLLPE